MMAAYQPQPGAMHPGMPHAHPGMTPGQPMNPAQMQQMGHPGVVTPGPHVTQAGAMMAMQPGAMGVPATMAGQPAGLQMGGLPAQMGAQTMAGVVPNVHAMNHLTPQQSMQQAQMMQHLRNNPHLMHQHMAQRQQQMAAIQQANGMAMQNGLQHLSPQQIQQLQANAQAIQPQGVTLPQHLQAQQQQLRLQQAQQNQHMQIAMQQAGSQQSNQGAQPAAQSQQSGQPNPGQPVRPQSRVANSSEQGQGTSQQTTQATAQQGQNQTQQQQSQPQAQQQVQANQQAQTGQQQAQQQAQQQQAQQAQQGQAQQAMNAQQMQMRQRQLVQQQQMRQIAQAQQSQQQSGNGAFILRAIQFADTLGTFDSIIGKDLMQWHAFVDKHFAPEGRLIHSFSYEGNMRRFEIPRAIIPRYFQMYFDTNASAIRLHLEDIREIAVQAGRHQVSFSNATFTVTFPNGARLEMHGHVRMLFAPTSDNIELMELHTASSEEHVSLSEIERVLSNWSETMGNKNSPKLNKKPVPKAQQKLQSQWEGLTIEHFPKTPKSKLGTTDRVQAFLEISECVSLMGDLIAYAQDKKLRPEQALEVAVADYEARPQGNPQINLPQNGVGLTPNMQHMQVQQGQFASPSMGNLNLPMQNGMPGMNGSPHIANNAGLAPNMNMPNSHTPSPHQSNMAAPQMVPQHSQQGTNSSAASANTSPNVNNKRRRSTVKAEDDGGDSSQGANRVKPSPRMPKKSKPGGA